MNPAKGAEAAKEQISANIAGLGKGENTNLKEY
jgi:hypothetical protein